MRRTGGVRDPPFSWVADPSSRLVVIATTGGYFFHHLGRVPFGEGTMLRTGGRVGTAPFFWQFVNGTHGIPDCLKRVVPLGRQQLRRIRPLQWRHSLPPFFIAYGGPNRERSSPPLLTVFLLLTGENQQEGGWVEKTRVQTSEGGNASGVFFVVPGSPVRSVGGNVGGISVSVGELVPGGLQ